MKLLKEMQDQSGMVRKAMNSELWHACAGPLVSLPQVGSLVYYFPQGHSEQVAVSTKRTATYQIPNYPNLSPQLMCQVHNITLHADKDTEEIYAQMSLQPVNTEKDVFPIPDFGIRHNKHPTEFFCKTLTASDTSTHGGFSVPRRAAEKLFPLLDYTAQPPTQELVVRDLHDNTWTFRHIYRGQPKRHLLTTGWSLFVGSKRLKAGDSVLFIRDEKSQLLVGVRHANSQQAALPSSVLSADTMHIGVLAAAAHAASNRSSFTIFYNPRACPAQFVIPLPTFRKSVYGTQISVGMRFGMMFETEESGKRRYMGTIVGISDVDPLRWPGSKWRNLQVEWDEPGCSDRPTRVSAWEIETPESLFIFPSLTSGLKRPYYPGLPSAETDWGSLIKRPLPGIPDRGNGILPYASSMSNLCYPSTLQNMINDKSQFVPFENKVIENQNPFQFYSGKPIVVNTNSSNVSLPTNMHPPEIPENQTLTGDEMEKLKPEAEIPTEKTSQLVSTNGCNEEKYTISSTNAQNQMKDQTQWAMQSQLESPQRMYLPESDSGANLLAQTDVSMFTSQDSSEKLMETINPSIWDHQLNNLRFFSQPDQFSPFMQQDLFNIEESLNQSCLNIDGSNGASTLLDPSVSSTILDELCTLKETQLQNPSDCMLGNFSCSQDVQSQITSTSFADSQAFSWRDFPDNSGQTSSSNVDESSLLQNNSSWQPAAPRVRTYTKVQKTGSVGRSIDVTNLKNYEELCSSIECMFGLEGLLSDTKGSGWKLVYVDYENDVLLVGDDPWEEFVGCVRCIRILSPTEVQQMSEEGMKLLNSAAAFQDLKNTGQIGQA